MHGIKLADETFIPGTCGKVGDSLEITIPTEKAIEHMADLMDPKKTEKIEFYSNALIATYEGYTKFRYMKPDSVAGKIDFWLGKGES